MNILKKPIRINFSPPLVALFGLIYLSAIIVICFLSINLFFRLALIGFCLIDFIKIWRKILLRATPESIKTFTALDENVWHLIPFEGEIIKTNLKSSSFVSRFLMILNFSPASSPISILTKTHKQKFSFFKKNKTFSIILTPQNIGRNEFRQLYIYTRHFLRFDDA